MSWHGAWHKSKPDPFAKPARPGDQFGCYDVVRHVEPDAHYGLRVLVRCRACGGERVMVLAVLRYAPPKRHRGCLPNVHAGAR